MIELTPPEMAALANLLNSVVGMENARALLPVWDKLTAAMRVVESEAASTGLPGK